MSRITFKLNLALAIIIFPQINLAQGISDIPYSVINPDYIPEQYFISTNSGVFKTPYGIKFGYIYDPGIYLGFRYGKGEELTYGPYSTETTSTKLFSIVGGLTKPIIIKNNLSLVGQLGLGYVWWNSPMVGRAKSGYEIEAGLLMKKKHFLINLTGNVFGNRAYATEDLCLGIGYVF